MGRTGMILVCSALFALLPGGGTQAQEEDVWGPFRPLLGRWQGEAAGFGNTATVTHHWQEAIQGKFLLLETRSISEGPDGPVVHEDAGFLSRDTDRSRYVFRHFLSEGFVNTFEVVVGTGDRPDFRFEPLESESTGGMRARMELAFVSDSGYVATLALAPPDGDFASCQRLELHRAR